MISVAEALSQITDLFSPLDVENIALGRASGRVLARNVTAARATAIRGLCYGWLCRP